MISENLFKELNNQVNFEFYSAYTYLAMASYAKDQDLDGFANFFRVQSEEELFHAMKLYDYIFQKNGSVELEQIAKPGHNFASITEAFEKGYAHEKQVTARFYHLADLALEEKEHATSNLLQWFINEQTEEEDTFLSLLKKVKRCEGNPAALYMLNDELATRTFTPPTNGQ